MRIRAVRPDFWSDETLGHLPDPVRLFYIGLWCVSDDAGWFEYSVSQLGASLYPYRPTRSREREIQRWTTALMESDRIALYPCGCGQIPTFERHQYQGGKKSFSQRDRHQRHVRTGSDQSGQVRSDTTVRLGLDRLGQVGSGEDWTEKVEAMRAKGHDA